MSGSKKSDNNKKDKQEAALQEANVEISELLERSNLSPEMQAYFRRSRDAVRNHPSRTPTPRPPSGNLPELEEFSSAPPVAQVPEAKKNPVEPKRGKKRKKPEVEVEGGRRKRKSRRSRRKRKTKRRKRKRRNSTRRKKRS